MFFKDADNPNKKDLIQKLTNKEVGLMQAQKSLSNISANRDLWIAQYRQELANRDKRSSISAALNKGLVQGLSQGRHEKAIETAKILKTANVDISLISKSTGLTEEEIAGL